jgi:hypothetical protein
VVITVVAVRVVEVIADQVVGVIAVRHRFVPAALTMTVIVVVRAATVLRRTIRRILSIHSQLMLIDVIAVRMMQVAVVKEVGVTVVDHGGVATVRAMLVIVTFVNRVCHVLTSRAGEVIRGRQPLVPSA